MQFTLPADGARIRTHQGDTKGDTKLSTVFVSTQPMAALASSRGKQFAAQVSDEITDVTASPYLSAVFGTGAPASFGNADHSGEDRTLDRAGAERESVAEFVRKVVALLLRRERGDDFLEARVAA